jgi:hypothetical protein
VFTTMAFFGAALLGWIASRAQKHDSIDRDIPNNLLLQCRQDLRLIAFLLFGVIVMLGVVADLLHQ